jgi:hypothetical protein
MGKHALKIGVEVPQCSSEGVGKSGKQRLSNPEIRACYRRQLHEIASLN